MAKPNLIKNPAGVSVPNAELEGRFEVERSRKEQAQHTTRTPRECGEPEPVGVKPVTLVAPNRPSTHFDQLARISCSKPLIAPTELVIALREGNFSGHINMLLGLFEVLVQGIPPRYVAGEYNLNVKTLIVKCSEVRKQIKEMRAQHQERLAGG
jgi:hypothetical protein